MNLFSLIPLSFPFLFGFIVKMLIQAKIKYKLTSMLIGILALISFYKAFEVGLALKNTEIYFAQDNRGKYADYTNSEKQTKIKELKKNQKVRRVKFTLFSISYWVAFLGVVFINFRFLKSKKRLKKSAPPPIITNNGCGNSSV